MTEQQKDSRTLIVLPNLSVWARDVSGCRLLDATDATSPSILLRLPWGAERVSFETMSEADLAHCNVTDAMVQAVGQ